MHKIMRDNTLGNIMKKKRYIMTCGIFISPLNTLNNKPKLNIMINILHRGLWKKSEYNEIYFSLIIKFTHFVS